MIADCLKKYHLQIASIRLVRLVSWQLVVVKQSHFVLLVDWDHTIVGRASFDLLPLQVHCDHALVPIERSHARRDNQDVLPRQ